MASHDNSAEAAPSASHALIEQQVEWVARVATTMNRMAELRQILAEGAAESAIACVESAILAQKDITAMTAEAASAQDPIALLSLPHRALQASLHHAMVCATRTVHVAQSLGSKAFSQAEGPDPVPADASQALSISAFDTPPTQLVRQRNPS